MPLSESVVADAYVNFLRGNGDQLLSVLADDFLDNVSGQRGRQIWRTVQGWLDLSFADVDVDLHSVARDDQSRVLVWITVHATHIGSPFPWLGGRAPTGRRVAWSQLHVFRVEGEVITEHWAVRDDLRVLEAIDRVD